LQGEAFDLPAMKRLIQTFEKKVYKNQEMRVKYPDDPTKFLDSEADLHEEIQNMTVLATAPDLYQVCGRSYPQSIG
jgi:beta-catenin-like protein 1